MSKTKKNKNFLMFISPKFKISEREFSNIDIVQDIFETYKNQIKKII